MTSEAPTVPIARYSTAHLPPSERYAEWLTWDWPRTEPIFRTVPSEDFNAVLESVPLGQLLFVRTEITGMAWERRTQDIRDSDFQPIIINMMIHGTAQGDLDGRAFFEPAGTYHFHDLARPSKHASTASLTYTLVLPRDVAKAWLPPISDLHGLVVTGGMARALIDIATTVWDFLPDMDLAQAARFERVFLELLAAGAEASRPTAPVRTTAGQALRARAVLEIEQKLGLGRASAVELGRVLGVSADDLGLAFRPDGGLKAYLLQRRLESVRAALTGLDRAEPIANIAHRLGFSDAAHLSRAFRSRFGLTPSAYRRLTDVQATEGPASPDL
ncbi:MAG: AraC-like DNA-binding protein [Brevundimonas sp.]|uniref:helix-turn-helix domain-containing protein n=1 Tax=Brevundimonas sp. TaxID=1871086 RepID=UPI0039E3F2E7